MDNQHGLVLIGITGKAQQGKSAFADLLDDCMSDALNLVVGRHGISTTFKETWCKLHGGGLTVNDLEDLKPEPVKGYSITHRRALELLGDFGREVDKHFWMDALWEDIKAIREGMRHLNIDYDVVIIPDVRTDDEAEWIRDKHGLIVHIHSDTLPTINSTHTVQTQPVWMDVQDIMVTNNGTLLDLSQTASEVALTIHRRYHG